MERGPSFTNDMLTICSLELRKKKGQDIVLAVPVAQAASVPVPNKKKNKVQFQTQPSFN